jgi:hypothetical protein
MNEQDTDRVNTHAKNGERTEAIKGYEKETYNITCRPRQNNPTVRPNTILLRICSLNLHHQSTTKFKSQSQKETKSAY